ncbi:MAG: hypothetical protein S4CHLAM45_13530 [Chlamydiales bacterium]|nr:hypothetical protein [Chlamydiales bacterium]MCH9620457.1 hypothetical protein [Chlamydiales bacterium]MCH9623443.1 hypothetical protein [Chlamydiales bacterium]
MKNKLLLNIFACGLVLSSPVLAAPWDKAPSEKMEGGWKSYTSSKSNFSVQFPTTPEEIDQTIEVPKTDLKISYNTFISEPNENSVYVVSVWVYPPEIDMSKPEVNLQDGFGGMLSALPGSEVLSMNMIEVQGHKALEFLVKNEDIFFQGKLILVNNTLYQVFTVYKSGVENGEDDYVKFIDSFKLLDDTKKTKKMKKLKV